MGVGSSRAVLQQEEQRWAVTNAPPQQAQPWAQPAPVPFHAYPAQQAAAGTAGAAEWEPAAYVSTNAGPPAFGFEAALPQEGKSQAWPSTDSQNPWQGQQHEGASSAPYRPAAQPAQHTPLRLPSALAVPLPPPAARVPLTLVTRQAVAVAPLAGGEAGATGGAAAADGAATEQQAAAAAARLRTRRRIIIAVVACFMVTSGIIWGVRMGRLFGTGTGCTAAPSAVQGLELRPAGGAGPRISDFDSNQVPPGWEGAALRVLFRRNSKSAGNTCSVDSYSWTLREEPFGPEMSGSIDDGGRSTELSLLLPVLTGRMYTATVQAYERVYGNGPNTTASIYI